MKGRFIYTFGARFLAFVLLIVLTVSVAASGVVVGLALAEDWYLGKMSDPMESDVLRGAVWENVDEVIRAYEDGWIEEYASGTAEGNFLFSIDGVNFDYHFDTCTGRFTRILDTRMTAVRGTNAVTEYYRYPADFDPASETGSGELLEYTVTAYLRDPLQPGDFYYFYSGLFTGCYGYRITAIVVGVVSLLLWIAVYVFLLCSAGHKPGVERPLLIRQDKIPLDLYLAVVGTIGLCVAYFIFEYGYRPYFRGLWVVLGASAALGIVLYAVLFAATSMTLAARFKVGRWWENTLIWHILRLCGRVLRWCCRKLVGALKLLPTMWRTVTVYVLFCLIALLFAGIMFDQGSFFALLLLFTLFCGGLALLVWLVLQMKTLQKGGEALANGELNHRIDTAKLFSDFRRHGENLNRVNEGISLAVEERMKSERFKTELITNVSHDLKTPLTSIVSYIDLLKKEDLSGTKAKEYVEVLDRQSMRLKKLTEDVVEASKASAGVIPVHASRMNVAELLVQVLGEFDERMKKGSVTPVLTAPPDGAYIMADGRLMWRVFDNLLQNICKYAMPGTRAYFDVALSAGMTEISVKNISAEPLGISAEELMERFVRGDSSRSGEGSGLGISIAKSLTELQGGTFAVTLDGDLFKVLLRFPAWLRDLAETEEPRAPQPGQR